MRGLVGTDFRKRVASIYSTMRRRTEEKRFRSGRNAGRIRRHAIPLPFSARDLEQWLLVRRGSPDKPYQCHYCSAWITLMTAVIDHKIPLRYGGLAGLENLDDICSDCNDVKGAMLPESFEKLLAFLRELGIRSGRCAQDVHSRLKMATGFANQRKQLLAKANQHKQAQAAAAVAGTYDDF